MPSLNPRRAQVWGALAAAALCPAASANDHLVISEVVLAPNAGEFIEIHNPTANTVDLSNYYLSDSALYGRVPASGNGFFPTPAVNDFIARFPAGASIGPGGTIAVAANATEYCAEYFGAGKCTFPTYELPFPAPDHASVPDMLPAYPGAVPPGRHLADAGEAVYLFHWDGASDLVDDIDILRAGQPTANDNVTNKTGLAIDGPDPGGEMTTYLPDSMDMPTMGLAPLAGHSYKRLHVEGLSETSCGGNGLTGHDETSEDIQTTWDGTFGTLTTPMPGVAGPLTSAPNQCISDIAPDPPDNVVDVNDLLALIGAWGPCADCKNCPGDIIPATCPDCSVDVNDLLVLIGNWGPCG